MGHIAFEAVAGGQTPTIGTITDVVFWILDTIFPVDEGVIAHLLKVIHA